MVRSHEYISATEFQRAIGETIDNVRTNQEVIIVQSHGRDQVVLLAPNRYYELLKYERRAKYIEVAKQDMVNGNETELVPEEVTIVK